MISWAPTKFLWGPDQNCPKLVLMAIVLIHSIFGKIVPMLLTHFCLSIYCGTCLPIFGTRCPKMDRPINKTNDHCLPDWLGAGPGPGGEPNPRNRVPKLQSCLSVRVEKLSSKKMARVNNLQQNANFEWLIRKIMAWFCGGLLHRRRNGWGQVGNCPPTFESGWASNRFWPTHFS